MLQTIMASGHTETAGLIPALYDPAISIRLVEVAKKYAGKDVRSWAT